MIGTDEPGRPAEVVELVRSARGGQQSAAHDRLISLTNDSRPLVAWSAAAAALGRLWWTGGSAAAGELAEQVVTTVGAGPDVNTLPGVPEFVTAVAAAAYYDAVDPGERIAAMITALPADHDQSWLLQRVRDRMLSDPGSLLPQGISEPSEMLPGDERLAGADPRSLTAEQVERLYLEAANCGRRDILLGLFNAGMPVPARSWALNWTGQVLAEAGRPAEAEPLFIASGPAWAPSAWWETLPWELPLGPRLRPWVSRSVQQAFAEQPIAEGWQ